MKSEPVSCLGALLLVSFGNDMQMNSVHACITNRSVTPALSTFRDVATNFSDEFWNVGKWRFRSVSMTDCRAERGLGTVQSLDTPIVV